MITPRCEWVFPYLEQEVATMLWKKEKKGSASAPHPLFKDGCSSLTKTSSITPLSNIKQPPTQERQDRSQLFTRIFRTEVTHLRTT